LVVGGKAFELSSILAEIEMDAPALKRRIITVLFVTALAAAHAAATPLRGFVSDKTHDYSGAYINDASVRVRNIELNNICMVTPGEFKDFEDGKRDADAPIHMHFFVDGETKNAHEGSNLIDIAPTAYRVEGGRLSFRAFNKRLGRIAFEGTFDPEFVRSRPAGVDPSDAPRVKWYTHGWKSEIFGSIRLAGLRRMNVPTCWMSRD
jgi:hypothetical protein